MVDRIKEAISNGGNMLREWKDKAQTDVTEDKIRVDEGKYDFSEVGTFCERVP